MGMAAPGTIHADSRNLSSQEQEDNSVPIGTQEPVLALMPTPVPHPAAQMESMCSSTSTDAFDSHTPTMSTLESTSRVTDSSAYCPTSVGTMNRAVECALANAVQRTSLATTTATTARGVGVDTLAMEEVVDTFTAFHQPTMAIKLMGPHLSTRSKCKVVAREVSSLLRRLCDIPELLKITVETWLQSADVDAWKAVVALSMSSHAIAKWLDAPKRLYMLRALLQLQQHRAQAPHLTRINDDSGRFVATRVAHVIELGQVRMLHVALSSGALHCAKACCELARTMLTDRMTHHPTLMEPTRHGGLWKARSLNSVHVLSEPRFLQTVNICSEMVVDETTRGGVGVCMSAMTTLSKITHVGKWKVPRQTVTFHFSSPTKPRQLQLHIAGGILGAAPTLRGPVLSPPIRASGIGVSMAMPSCNGEWALVALGCETDLTQEAMVGAMYSLQRFVIGRLHSNRGATVSPSPSNNHRGDAPCVPEGVDDHDALLRQASDERLVPSDTVRMQTNFCEDDALNAIQASVYKHTKAHRTQQLVELDEDTLFFASMAEVSEVLNSPVARDPLRLMGACIEADGTATLFTEPSDSAYVYDDNNNAHISVHTNVVNYSVVTASSALCECHTFRGHAIASSVVGRPLFVASKDGRTAIALVHREAAELPVDIPRMYSLVGRVVDRQPRHMTSLEEMHACHGFTIKCVYDMTLVDAQSGVVAILASVVCVDAGATAETHLRYEPLALVYAAMDEGHPWHASPNFVSLPCESGMRNSVRSHHPLFHGTCTASPSGTLVFVHASSVCEERLYTMSTTADGAPVDHTNFGAMVDQIPFEPSNSQWRVIVPDPLCVKGPLVYMHALPKFLCDHMCDNESPQPELWMDQTLFNRWTQEGQVWSVAPHEAIIQGDDASRGQRASSLDVGRVVSRGNEPPYSVPRSVAVWMASDEPAMRCGEVTVLHAAPLMSLSVGKRASVIVKANWTADGFVMEVAGGACLVSAVPSEWVEEMKAFL